MCLSLPDPYTSQQARMSSEELPKLRWAIVPAKTDLLLFPLKPPSSLQCRDSKQGGSLLSFCRPWVSLFNSLDCKKPHSDSKSKQWVDSVPPEATEEECPPLIQNDLSNFNNAFLLSKVLIMQKALYSAQVPVTSNGRVKKSMDFILHPSFSLS